MSLFFELTFSNLLGVTSRCEKGHLPLGLRLRPPGYGSCREASVPTPTVCFLVASVWISVIGWYSLVAAGMGAHPLALPTSACCSHLPLPTLCPFSHVSSDLPNGALPSVSFSAETLFLVCIDNGGVETGSQHVAHVGLKPSMKWRGRP